MTNFYDGFDSWSRRLAEQARSAFDVHAQALAACDDLLNGSRRALGMYEESQAASLRMANTVFSDDALSRYIDDITLPGTAAHLLPEFGLSQVEKMLLAQEMPTAMRQLQEAERDMEHWFAQYGDRSAVKRILSDIEEQTRQAQQVMGSPELHLGWNSADYLDRWAKEVEDRDAATRRMLDSLDLHHFDRSARELEEWIESPSLL